MPSRMFTTVVLMTAVLLAGCSSAPKPPPLPDGQHRVPVNEASRLDRINPNPLNAGDRT